MECEKDIVHVNLLDVIASVQEAGKLYRDHHHEIDLQLLRVKDPDVAGVFLDAADKAKEMYDKGANPHLKDFDRSLFDIGYSALKSGEIRVCNF